MFYEFICVLKTSILVMYEFRGAGSWGVIQGNMKTQEWKVIQQNEYCSDKELSWILFFARNRAKELNYPKRFIYASG
jgi:hypothetical protein